MYLLMAHIYEIRVFHKYAKFNKIQKFVCIIKQSISFIKITILETK